MSKNLSASSCAAFAPSINFSPELPGYPVRYNLGPLSAPGDGAQGGAFTNYIPGHVATIDSTPGLTHRERRARIVQSRLLLPNDPIIKLRTMLHSRARHMIIPIPMAALNQNAECLYDIDVRDSMEPSFEGRSIAACYSIICGLLGEDGSGKGFDGIGHSYVVDTEDEYKQKQRRGGGPPREHDDEEMPGPAANANNLSLLEQEDAASNLLGNDFVLSGHRSNRFMFMVRDRISHVECEVDRFLVDMECLAKNPADNETFAFRNPEVIIVHIWIIDPRISLSRGLERMIKRNQQAVDKEQRMRRPESSKKSTPSAVAGENDVHVLDTRSLFPYGKVRTWLEWARILEGVNKKEHFEMNYMKAHPDHAIQGACAPYLDPANALSPPALFPDASLPHHHVGPNYRPAFRYTLFKAKNREAWTDLEFFGNVGHGILSNAYPITYVASEFLAGPVFQPGTRDLIMPNEEDVDVEHREVYQNLTLYVYPYPNRTVRIPVPAIGSIRGLSMLFPFREQIICGILPGMLPQTILDPFPCQLPDIVETNRDRMLAIEARLAKREGGTLIRDSEHDRIFHTFFGNPDEDATATTLRELYSSQDRSIGKVRFSDIFPMAWRALTPNNNSIPPTLRAMLAWVERNPTKKGNRSLFTNLYDPGLGFRYYHNLSAHGNFMVNFMEKFLQQTLQTWHNHRLYLLAFTFIANQMKLRIGYQPQLLFYGKTSSGKSKILRMLVHYLIPETMSTVDSQSAAATSTHSDLDGRVNITDEVNQSNNPLFDVSYMNLRSEDDDGRASSAAQPSRPKNSLSMAGSATEKKKVTTGQTTRSVIHSLEDGTRITLHVVSNNRSICIYCSNEDYSLLDPAIRSRIMAFYVPARRAVIDIPVRKRARLTNTEVEDPSERFEDGNSSSSSVPNLPSPKSHYEKEFSDIMCRYQAFCGIANYLAACGAIDYSKASLNDVEEVMSFRLQTAMQKLWPGFKGLNAREHIDIFGNMLRAVVFQRLWCDICSGCYSDPDLRPDAELSMNTFVKIQQYGLLMPTTHDYCVTISYFEDILPSAGQTAVTEWVVRRAMAVGYVPARDSTTPSNYTCFRLKTAELSSRTDPETGASHASTFNLFGHHNSGQGRRDTITGQHIAEIPELNSSFDWTHKYDPDFIDLGIPLDTWDNIKKKAIEEIFKERDNCSVHGLTAAFNSLTSDEVEFRTTITERSAITREITLSYNTHDTAVGKALTMSKGIESTDKYKLLVPRHWLDSICSKDSYFARPMSTTQKDFRASPLERAVEMCGYTGMRSQTILLPGMTLCNPMVKNSPIATSMSNIMKTVRFDGSTESGKLFIPGDDYVSGKPLMGPWERPRNSRATYEDCCYTRVLSEQMRNMDIVWGTTTDVTPSIATKDDRRGFQTRSERAFMEYAPVFSDARFHRARGRTDRGRLYPDTDIEQQLSRLANPTTTRPIMLESYSDRFIIANQLPPPSPPPRVSRSSDMEMDGDDWGPDA